MPSSTKWRVNITANYDATPWTRLYEIKMMLAAGGTDQCSGGTASASSAFSTLTADKAFDDDLATRWQANVASGWIQYEFAAAKSINSLALYLNGGSGPKDFTLDYWDGSAWQSLFAVTGYPNDTNPFWRVLGGASKERWRIKVTDTYDGADWLSLSEIQLRGSVGGADLCSGGIATASFFHSSFFPDYLFDNDTSTSVTWTGSLPHWAEYAFGSSVDVAEIVLTATDTTYYRAPKDFALEYWDGSAWVEKQAWTGEPAWSSNESRTYAVSGGGSPAARRRPLYIAGG